MPPKGSRARAAGQLAAVTGLYLQLKDVGLVRHGLVHAGRWGVARAVTLAARALGHAQLAEGAAQLRTSQTLRAPERATFNSHGSQTTLGWPPAHDPSANNARRCGPW